MISRLIIYLKAVGNKDKKIQQIIKNQILEIEIA